MGSRVEGEKRRRPRGAALIAVSLAMLVVSVPALAAQTPAGPSVVSGDQNTLQPGPPGGLGVCDHAPGEFLVGYDSEEAMKAASQENVVDTIDNILVQYVAYGEIKNEPDPAIRSATEETKRQELEARPGVNYVEYNCSAGAEAMAAPALADCGECGVNIGRQAARIIGGSEGADGKTAYEIALEAARSADEGNVAFASESGEGNTGESNIGEEDMDAADTGEEATADAKETETDGKGGEEARESGEETATAAAAGGNASRDAGAGTVNDAVASGESRVNSPLLALGGGMLLVAGVFLARKVFGE